MTMKTSVSEENGAVIVRLEGDIDLEHSVDVRNTLLDAADKRKNMLVDLSGVSYIDSSGIANLVEALQKTRETGTSLGLVSISLQAMRVLQLARLDRVFTIYADMAAAEAGMKG